MYSIMHKDSYVRTIPKRTLKLLIRFDVAIVLFLIVGLMIGKHYPLQRILLSFIGWKSVGNSNWYIFVVLCLYVFTFVADTIFKNKYTLIALFVAACGLGYILLSACWEREHTGMTQFCVIRPGCCFLYTLIKSMAF